MKVMYYVAFDLPDGGVASRGSFSKPEYAQAVVDAMLEGRVHVETAEYVNPRVHSVEIGDGFPIKDYVRFIDSANRREQVFDPAGVYPWRDGIGPDGWRTLHFK